MNVDAGEFPRWCSGVIETRVEHEGVLYDEMTCPECGENLGAHVVEADGSHGEYKWGICRCCGDQEVEW